MICKTDFIKCDLDLGLQVQICALNSLLSSTLHTQPLNQKMYTLGQVVKKEFVDGGDR